jgi:hypothetical protein
VVEVVVLIKQQEILQVVMAVAVPAEVPIQQAELPELQTQAAVAVVGGKVQPEMAVQAAPASSSSNTLTSTPSRVALV